MPVAGFPTIHVLAGFPSEPGERYFTLDVSLLDGDDVLAPDGGGFVEITDRLAGELEPIDGVRGRSSPLQDYGAGRFAIRCRNLDGDLDPINLAGDYVLGGVSLIECGRRMQVLVELADGTIEERLTGHVESYEPDLSDPEHPVMVIECAGQFVPLARVDPAASVPSGGGELSGARQHRILDVAGVPDADREIDAGLVAVQETTLAQPSLTEARLTSATESPLGGFYETRAGRLAHDGRLAPMTKARMRSPRATFGPLNAANKAAGVLPYVSLSPIKNKDLLINSALIARTGGEAQTGIDATSIAKFFEHMHRRTDLLHLTDLESAAYVDALLSLFTECDYRYQSVTIDLNAVPDDQVDDMVAFMSTCDVRDRIAVLEQVTYWDGDTPTVRENLEEVFIERIDEHIGFDSWRMTFELWSARAFTDVFTLDVSLLDGTDVLGPL